MQEGTTQEGHSHVSEEDMAYVAYRVARAMETIKKLPCAWPRGPQCQWPEMIRNHWTEYGYHDPTPPKLPPSARAITEMDEVVTWLRWLADKAGKRTMRVVMLHAMGLSFSDIAYKHHRRAKSWAHGIYWEGIFLIAHNFTKK